MNGWDGLNGDQREYRDFLGTLPPEDKCPCGWYHRGASDFEAHLKVCYKRKESANA